MLSLKGLQISKLWSVNLNGNKIGVRVEFRPKIHQLVEVINEVNLIICMQVGCVDLDITHSIEGGIMTCMPRQDRKRTH